MVVLGGGQFLVSEVPLAGGTVSCERGTPVCTTTEAVSEQALRQVKPARDPALVWLHTRRHSAVQGYLAHKKTAPP